MITKVTGEAPFQILTNNFSISPSQEGYTLQISADGKNYSSLFTVGANTTRLVTGVAANSYYRLLGNESEVTINWMKTCVTEGGGGSGSGSTYTAGEYISIEQDVISVTGITPDQYLTSADTQDLASKAYVTAATQDLASEAYVDAAITAGTQDLASQGYVDSAITAATQDLASQGYVDSAITAATQGLATEAYVTAATQGFMTEADVTAITSPIQTQLDDVERVTATALTELHQDIVDLSGATSGYATHAEVTAATQNMATQAYVTAATQGMATQTWVGQQGYITSAYTGFTTTEDFEEFAGQMEVKEEVVASAITELHETKVEGVGVKTIEKISQADYDDLVSGGTVDSYTFYVITGQTSN